ncbi:MAG: hypothetical protein KDK91_13495 [Gammaproteobacteria bacterium]|nr:hypothetical protein [Gammaproteobacteria bacterium]
MTTRCPWCEAPRNAGPTCPSCGANYAKAEAIRARGRANANPPGTAATSSLSGIETYTDDNRATAPVSDPRFEYLCCLYAMPCMLLLAGLLRLTGFGASVQRIVFGMPVHELGHAVVGWLSGYSAIPTLWKTITPTSRGYIAPALLFAAIAALTWQGLRHKTPGWLLVALGLFVLQVYATFVIDQSTATMLITFAGDGMGMVLATVLMSLFYIGKQTQIYKGALRWGFMAIGAAAFADMFVPWWLARGDIGHVGYGMTGGIATDAFKLINHHGWSWSGMIRAHVTIGLGCLLVLASVYTAGLWQARHWWQAQARADRLDRLRAPRSGRS